MPKAKYRSKEDLYRDFDLVVKLHVSGGISPNTYDQVLGELHRDDRARVRGLEDDIASLPGRHGVSRGVFIATPVKGPQNEAIGEELVLLFHESGPELFVKASAGPAISKLVTALAQPWKDMLMGHRLTKVELRSLQKGCIAMPASSFTAEGLECVCTRFHSVARIFECRDCFDPLHVTEVGDGRSWD